MIRQINEVTDIHLINELKAFPNQGFVWEIIEKKKTGKIFELHGGAVLIIDNCCDPFIFIAGQIEQEDIQDIVLLAKSRRSVMLYCNAMYHTMFLNLGWDFRVWAECSLNKLKRIALQDADLKIKPIKSIDIFRQCTWYKEESELYGSVKNFLQHGTGYALCKDDIVLSEVYAHIGRGYLETGVATHTDYRSKGYGTSVASYMLDYFSEEDVIPQWNCNITNRASLKVALKLGFQIKRYHVYLVPDVKT